MQTLPLEGGPEPYEVMPDGGGFAAWRAADLVQRLLHDGGGGPSWFRDVLLWMAAINLRWAARSLGMSPLGESREPSR